MNPALHHDGIALPPAHASLKLVPPHARLPPTYSHYSHQTSPPYAIPRSSNYDPPGNHYEFSPTKRQRLDIAGESGDGDSGQYYKPVTAAIVESRGRIGVTESRTRGPGEMNGGRPRGNSIIDSRPATATATGIPATPTPTPVASKSRRVRTGCLTCRERHLKCDEGLPDCNNCRKSNRGCKRGVRLNFIDVQVKKPPYILPPAVDWSVQFEDESRLIASEYRGGLGRYPRLDAKPITPPREPDLDTVLRQSSVRSRTSSAAGLREGYYPGSSSLAPTPGPTGYDESQLAQMSGISSRKDSGPIATAQTPASQAGPSPIIGPGSGAFSLHMLHDQYAREDTIPRNHVYRGSDDTSSVASSLVPQGAGPGSQNLRPSALGPGLGGRATPDGLMTPPSERAAGGERDYLSDDEEIRFMQVFIDEVAIWMDTLDRDKHFANATPYLALKSPMMLNAFLACGVKHLTLVEGGAAGHNHNQNDDKALFYYDTATTQLLRHLQNPDRNMAECAATAVVLNVYEIMSEKPTQRMNHIAGARALIRECGWDATTEGVGGACFWLNIGMEVLSCLHFNWQIAWEPDQWGLDLGFITNAATTITTATSSSCAVGGGGGAGGIGNDNIETGCQRDEDGPPELWAQRMFYIVAKIVNFRANIPRFQEPSPHDEQVRLQSRFAEWKRLKAMCDAWNNNCPRAMTPFGYSHSPSTKSLFPNIWLIKRPAVIGRLFYHTAMCVLAQINPLSPRDSDENRALQLHHAHQVCGIVAHTRDRGVASVAIRSLATSSAVLADRHEQAEVLSILDKISRETGWRLGKVLAQLKRDWGWEGGGGSGEAASSGGGGGVGGGHHIHHHHQQQQQQQQQQLQLHNPNPHHAQHRQNHNQPRYTHAHTPFPSMTATTSTAPASSSSSSNEPLRAPTPLRPLVNPLLVNADFANRNHPYKNWYEPPNRAPTTTTTTTATTISSASATASATNNGGGGGNNNNTNNSTANSINSSGNGNGNGSGGGLFAIMNNKDAVGVGHGGAGGVGISWPG